MPWKNGLGVTTEIARFPLDGDFLWRVSTARIDQDGPFSQFPGYDRVILALDGGFVLDHRETGTEALLGAMEPYAFPGDSTTLCALREGPVRDFNVITRRDAFHAHVDVVRLVRPLALDASGDVTLIYCAQGTVRVRCNATVDVAEGETILLRSPEDAGIELLAARDSATLIVVNLSAAASRA